MRRVYLDTAASTPIEKKVLRAIEKFSRKHFGNASSIHAEGVVSFKLLQEARGKIAKIIDTRPKEIVFTSGGTEANNLAILGVAGKYEEMTGKKGHMIVSNIEHASVLEPVRMLARAGWMVSEVPVEKNGVIDPAKIKATLREDTALVSVGYVNNEIGTLGPLKAIAKIIRFHRKVAGGESGKVSFPYFHTDACQAPRFFPLELSKLGVDLMTINSSKIYGPKGVGALVIRSGASVLPIVFGGGQEQGLRSGTENVAGVIGMAEALSLCDEYREKESENLKELRDYFSTQVITKIEDVVLNGDKEFRSPNNINLQFKGVNAELLVIELDAKGIACSTGSACSAQSKNESHVIGAIADSVAAQSSVRFTLGRDTKKRDINYVVKSLIPIIKKLRHSESLANKI